MAHKKIGIYIGRFQPFHNGHAQILKRAIRENDSVIVLIGSSYQAATTKNPFTYEERRAMIEAWVNPADVHVKPLRDFPYNDAKWIATVQQVVAKVADRDSDITLYGSERDESTWYLKAFPQWKLDLVDPFPINGNLSATGLREQLFSRASDFSWHDLPPSSVAAVKKFVNTTNYDALQAEYDFITNYKKQYGRGVIDEMIKKHANSDPEFLKDLEEIRRFISPHPPTFVTTDAVVVQSGHLLVVERNNYPGRGLWALPGGHLKQHLTLLDNTIVELIEETGIRLATGKRSKEITEDILRNAVKGEKNFDHPDRSLRGRTTTTAFYFRLDDTKPLPHVQGMNMPLEETGGKEIVETNWARWIQISEARANPHKWFEDHSSIVDFFVG